jgi:uncharacterized protein
MPATLTYPGVYIEEIPSGVHTITGVATSITAFFGRTSKGALNRPVHCLSFADFTRAFGDPHPSSDLAASVRQFYDNGGSDCYVVRLAKGAKAAAVTLCSPFKKTGVAVPVLDIAATAEGAWANTLRLEVDYNTTQPGATFNLRVSLEEAGVVTQTESFTGLSMDPTSPRYAPSFITSSSQLIAVTANQSVLGDPTDNTTPSAYNTISGAATVPSDNSFAGFCLGMLPLGTSVAAVRTTLNTIIKTNGQTNLDVSVNGSNYLTADLSTTWTNTAATYVDLASEIAAAINHALTGLSPAQTVSCDLDETVTGGGRLLKITIDSLRQVSVQIRRSSASDAAAALMLGVDQGGLELARFSNFRPAPTGTFFALGGSPGDLTNILAIDGLQQNAITALNLDGTPVALNAAPYSLVTTAGTDRWFTDANASSPNGNNDGLREKLRIIANAVSNNASVPYTAQLQGYQLVVLAKGGTINVEPVTISTGTAGFDNALVKNVRQYTLGTSGTGDYTTGSAAGDDGTAPVYADYVGDPVHKTGFHALDTVDLFNLMVLPTDYDLDEPTRLSFWGPASIYCQSRRAFLLIDAPESWTSGTQPAVVNDTSKVSDLRATVIKDYSAVFYPRLKYTDDQGVIRLTGPTGAMAGLMARIDASRGVWKAPAGTEADLRGLAGLEVKLTDLENGVLNKLGVNCQRVFPVGFTSWGARTMDGADDFGSDWKYIPIRRLALMIEESLYRGTQWAVFEPNDEPLWARIRLNVGVFMMGLFRQGAFQGSTPDQAFYVKCDSETTTQADRNLGIVNIQVGFAPLKPAEFVVITIQQMAGNLT